ncbi:recombinase family protein [Nonomuraea sp. ZG12]|uniref:recombinase family protein n=1 Tax=Nonomuraea sp. ZG12 TaxID=3452207 RepID=UPI003F8CBA8F
MQIVYSRVSTATQSLLRQRHILTEAGLLVRTEGVAEGFRPADGVLLFEDPATTSKIPALDRPAFGKIAAKAHPGDTLTVSELFRLCRDLLDIHAVRNWCQARGVALRVLSGPLSNFHDLAATDVIINVITAVGQFQRDIRNELTVEGIAAAQAEGRYRGRPPALDGDRREDVRAAFHEGTCKSIATLTPVSSSTMPHQSVSSHGAAMYEQRRQRTATTRRPAHPHRRASGR